MIDDFLSIIKPNIIKKHLKVLRMLRTRLLNKSYKNISKEFDENTTKEILNEIDNKINKLNEILNKINSS